MKRNKNHASELLVLLNYKAFKKSQIERGLIERFCAETVLHERSLERGRIGASVMLSSNEVSIERLEMFLCCKASALTS